MEKETWLELGPESAMGRKQSKAELTGEGLMMLHVHVCAALSKFTIFCIFYVIAFLGIPQILS